MTNHVQSWFATTSLGPAFIAPKGRAYQLTEKEAIELRDEAELRSKALGKGVKPLDTIIIILIALVAFAAFHFLKLDRYVDRATMFAVVSAAAILFMAAWDIRTDWYQYKAIRALRNEFGERLMTRPALPDVYAEPVTGPNPFRTLFTILAYTFLYYAIVSGEFDSLPHFASEEGFLPMMGFLVFMVVLGYIANWYDTKRGIG